MTSRRPDPRPVAAFAAVARHAAAPATGSTPPVAGERQRAARLRVATLLMALSGFAGLGYQIVWTQQFGVWLGNDIVAVLAVVAAFFGGLGIGAWALAGRVAASPRPARWYVLAEAVIGGWSLVLIALLPPANAALAHLSGPAPAAAWQWTVAFLGPFVLLLPATAAMGATLPAIERLTQRLRHAPRETPAGSGRIGGAAPAGVRPGRWLGRLYAANTFGAVAGVLASAFVLVPQFGLVRTAGVCVALNLACALVAWRAFGRQAPAAVEVNAAGRAHEAAASPTRRLRLTLFATGALGIGYEVVVVRVLSQVAEDTVYTFALLLAVYLLGSAAGAAFYQRRFAARSDAGGRAATLLCALAASCLAGTLGLWSGPAVLAALAAAFGGGVAARLGAEAAVALVAFALPTFVMGALFCHLCGAAQRAGRCLGSALGINTLGAAFAPLVFGVLLVPALGPKHVLAAIMAGYLLLAGRAAWQRAGRARAAGAVALGTLALATVGGPLAFVDVPEGGRIVSYRDGAMASVSVVEDAGGVATLRIDNRQQEGSSASAATDTRLALLPLRLHAAPARALFLGLGTGVTARAAAADSTLAVEAVELLPEVVAAADLFAARPDSAAAGSATPAGAARLHVTVGDARRFVRTSDARYDVIVADLFHPARSGAGALYTVEHFAAIGARLAAGGVFCQWLPLHQLDLATLRSITRSFLAVHPDAFAVLATNSLDTPVVGLVARPGAARIDLAALRARLAARAAAEAATALVGGAPAAPFGDEFALLGSVIAGPAALQRFAAAAPLNTDDRPVVAHRAPLVAYAPESSPRDRLQALLHEVQPQADELLGAPADADARHLQQRLEAYWAARTRFIDLGIGVQPGGDARRMLEQIGAPLLQIVRASPDFRPAYDPLLRLAQALARTDPPAARALLAELAQANPARRDAAALRERLP